MDRSKPDRTFTRGIYYFDVVAALVTVMIVLGHLGVSVPSSVPPITRDVLGWWTPLLAVVLLVALRRRAYTQETPWVVTVFAAVAFVGIAATFWRWRLMVLLAAIGSASLLLPAGLVLRNRRVSEKLSQRDVVGLIAMGISVTLTVALTEGGLRALRSFLNEDLQQVLRADSRNTFVADPYIGHLHKPNNTFVLSGRDFRVVHQVDPLGFRNAWPWPDRAEIVVVGDSLTFGFGVEDEDSWPYLLARPDSSRRVINLSLIGAGPQQYLRVFERFGVTLRPKLLVVGLFAQNDFWDADRFDRWLESGLGGNFMTWQDFRPKRVGFSIQEPLASFESLLRLNVLPTLRRSYLHKLLWALRGGFEAETATPPRIFRFANGKRLRLRESDMLSKSASAQPGYREFDLVLGALREIHALAARHGTRTLIVMQPGKEQVYLPLMGETVDDLTVALRSALDRLSIDYLDLEPEFRARAADGEQLFYEVDAHPNKVGHALTAQLVMAHIKQNADRYGLTD